MNTSQGQVEFERYAGDASSWSIIGTPPLAVWGKIQEHYIRPLRLFGIETGLWLRPSARSCYRAPAYERARGRSGASMHCFPPGTRGACDLVKANGLPFSDGDLATIKARLPFARLCWYPNNGFLHVDYGERSARKGRSWFTCKASTAAWVFAVTLSDIKTPGA